MKIPDLQAGEHAVLVTDPIHMDRVAFATRREGLEVRDTLFIHMPEILVTALLVREAVEDSILESTVRGDAGTLPIDACRVPVDDEEKGDKREHGGAVYDGVAEGYQRKNKSCYTHKTDWHMKAAGRWPTNTLLVHGAGCEDTCQSICPVVLLDQISGDRPSTLSAHGHHGRHPSMASYADKERRSLNGGLDMPGSFVYGDSGGASRFFRQLESVEDLIWYLAKMTGSVDRVLWVNI